jgi:type II secretion system protein G
MYTENRTTVSLPSTHNTGFTLIELLVVIAIISLLSSVVLSSLSGVRADARDASRRQDFRQIKQALEMYFNDKGHYPKCPVSSNYIDKGGVCPPSYAGAALEAGGYLTDFPRDPLYGGDGDEDWGNDYQYRTFDNGQQYFLRTAFEGSLQRTHDYPDGNKCPSPQFSVCDWKKDPRCVYVTGSDCDTYWLETSSGSS